MTLPGLVIFDCDGVLVDSEAISMRELTRTLASIGGTLDEAAVHATFSGMALPAIEKGVAAHLGRSAPEGWLEDWLTSRAAAFERELLPIPADLFPRERIFSGTMVEHGKPAPDLYLFAAAACGFAPAACVVVEDSPTGVKAARAAEMRVLGYVADAADSEAAARLTALGAEVFHDMREVPERVAD